MKSVSAGLVSAYESKSTFKNTSIKHFKNSYILSKFALHCAERAAGDNSQVKKPKLIQSHLRDASETLSAQRPASVHLLSTSTPTTSLNMGKKLIEAQSDWKELRAAELYRMSNVMSTKAHICEGKQVDLTSLENAAAHNPFSDPGLSWHCSRDVSRSALNPVKVKNS